METFLSAVLADLLSRSISFVIDRYCQQQQGVEENLQQLQRMLLRIQTVVEEANGRRITNQAMLLQLKTMRNVMYRGYYFLDNFRYRIALGHAPDEVDDHSLASFPFNPLKRFRFSTMARKIVSEDQEKKELLKMLGRLESIISEEFVMSLRSYPRMVRQPYCSYLLLENCMFGRQAEQERIISFLLEPHRAGAEGVAVLPIIGPARVGKSTLVENVCHDERVRKYFSTIVFYYTGSTEGAVADTGVIKHQNPASTKQSLVVIELVDDMDDETWRRILSSLRGDNIAAPVSKIIITSQSNKIATFGTTETLQLDMLPKEAFWYFLKTIAFGSTNPEEEPKLTSICMEIAAQANGAFLHANIIGGILRSNFSVQFWYKVLKRMKIITNWHFRLLGEHPRDMFAAKSGRTIVWFSKLNRFVPVTYNEASSSRLNDHPTSNAFIAKKGQLDENIDALEWQSSIPPYYKYRTRYAMIEQPNTLSTGKRSRSLSEGCTLKLRTEFELTFLPASCASAALTTAKPLAPWYHRRDGPPKNLRLSILAVAGKQDRHCHNSAVVIL
ncbi:hypothetical protein OsI_08150 [Oryza sativa Indica Group]|uniref:Disease resistance N-terminal domain-containing protein n=2 Tax=Oryza TaxID=4527 RepID=A2X7G0_ORYSI|nr:hypothetical protein OsI_08150 [Oryza sativa Indica Group]